MYKDRALTYSILAHIRTKSTLIKGPLDIFKPLVKRVLSKMNNDEIFSGKNISEIKVYSDKLYDIDFPIPVLEKILRQLAQDINTDDNELFKIYQDKSFRINGYVFTEFEEDIRKHQIEIENLEKLFRDFCESSGIEFKDKSIFKFIEKNKFSLSKYLSKSEHKNGADYSVEAQFVDYFKRITPVYELIKRIYLGSLLAGYIEYTPENVKTNVELLLDTNFVLGLLNLNTLESTHTCTTLLKIAISQGYVCKVMSDTIEEIKALLKAKCDYFDQSFLQRKVYPEDIYNACERRGLNKVDLELISDKLESKLSILKIYVLHDTSKIKNEARFSDEYNNFKRIRSSDRSALHDAMAIIYVKRKRTKTIYDFEKANCWFVNNAISREGQNTYDRSGKQPEIIKADDLLNILWLSNPQSKIDISDEELVDIGLSSIISLTLNESLPKTSIIRELEDNIQKYSGTSVTDEDIIRIATRITSKQLNDIEVINALAISDKEGFVNRLQLEAKKQKEIEIGRLKMLESAVQDLTKKGNKLEKIKHELEEKSKNIDTKSLKFDTDVKDRDNKINHLQKQLLNEINDKKRKARKEYYDDLLYKWRRKSWIEFCISLILFISSFIYVFYISNWNVEIFAAKIIELKGHFIAGNLIALFSIIFSGIVIKTFYDKYRNHSNIENYKKSFDLPKEFEELKNIDDEALVRSKGFNI